MLVALVHPPELTRPTMHVHHIYSTTGELQSADGRHPSAQQERPSAQAVPTVTVGVASSA
jgi:hypothetical protein